MSALRSIAVAKNIFVIAGTGTFNETSCVVEGGLPINMSLPWKDREFEMMKAINWWVSHLMTFTGSDTATGLYPDDYNPVPIQPNDPEYIDVKDLFEATLTIPTAIRARENGRRFGWSCGTSASATVSLAMAHGILGRLINGQRIEYFPPVGHDFNLGGDYCCELYSTRFNRWVFFFQHSYAWFEDKSLGNGGEPIGIKELVANDRFLADSISLHTDGRPGVGDFPNGSYVTPPIEWVAYLNCGPNEENFIKWTWVAAAAPSNRLRFMPENLIPIPSTPHFGYAMLPPTQACSDTRTYGTSATIAWWKAHFRYMLMTYKTRPNTGLTPNPFYNGCDYIITEENQAANFTREVLGNFPLCQAASPSLTYSLNNVHASASFLNETTVLIQLSHNLFSFLRYETSLDGGPWQPISLHQPNPNVTAYHWFISDCGSRLAIRGVNLAGVHSPDVVVRLNCNSMSIVPAALPGGAVGNAYNDALIVTGGVAPYSVAVVSGNLPVGLTLLNDGNITGFPLIEATTNFVVEASDAAECTTVRSYSIAIDGACQLHADLSGDGVANGRDIRPFVECVSAATVVHGTCDCGDFNSSGTTDLADVSHFVNFLLNL